MLVLWAHFAARDSAVHLAEVWFELRDAPDIRFELLPPPGRKSEPYQFRDGGLEVPQEQVVNTFFPGTLYRHHPIEGYMMGVAYQPLPVRLTGMLGAKLSVINELGETVGSARFKIPLDPEEHGKWYTGRRRRGLYEPLDEDEEPIVPEVPLQRKPFIVPRNVPSVPPTETPPRPRGDGTGK